MEQRSRSSAAATSSGTDSAPYSATPGTPGTPGTPQAAPQQAPTPPSPAGAVASVTAMSMQQQGGGGRVSAPVLGGARILVVDDDPGMLQTITWILKEHGYDVASAQGGDGMWEQLEARLPDLVLL